MKQNVFRTIQIRVYYIISVRFASRYNYGEKNAVYKETTPPVSMVMKTLQKMATVNQRGNENYD